MTYTVISSDWGLDCGHKHHTPAAAYKCLQKLLKNNNLAWMNAKVKCSDGSSLNEEENHLMYQ